MKQHDYKLNFSLRFFVLLALTLGVYWFIFAMSAQDGATSGDLSGKLIAFFVPRDSNYYALAHTLLRKAAHVSEFLLLFLLWYGTVSELFSGAGAGLWLGLPYALTLFSAAADEFHQLFVPGRTGLMTDVLIDMSGVTLIALVLFIYHSFGARNRMA